MSLFVPWPPGYIRTDLDEVAPLHWTTEAATWLLVHGEAREIAHYHIYLDGSFTDAETPKAGWGVALIAEVQPMPWRLARSSAFSGSSAGR